MNQRIFLAVRVDTLVAFFFSAINSFEMGSVQGVYWILITTYHGYWLFKYEISVLYEICTVHKLIRCHHRKKSGDDYDSINKISNESKLKKNIRILFLREVLNDKKYSLPSLSKLPLKTLIITELSLEKMNNLNRFLKTEGQMYVKLIRLCWRGNYQLTSSRMMCERIIHETLKNKTTNNIQGKLIFTWLLSTCKN